MKKIVLIGLVLVLTLVFVGCQEETPVVEVEKNITPVEVMLPKLASITNETHLVSKLIANETAIVTPKVMSAEEVLEVFYSVGDYVEQDAVIAVLDTESTDDQVENARLSYVTAQRNYNAVAESLATAKANLERTQKLFDEGVVSEQQLENAKLQASDGQLKTLASQLSQAKFAYENAQEGLENTTIVAPISGVISTLGLEKFNMATAQSSVVITNMDTFKVSLQVSEEVITKMTDSTTVEVSLESTDEPLASMIKTVNPVANQQTGLYGVELEVSEGSNLKPGMFVNVRIQFEGHETLIIPIDSVLNDEDGDYVYVIVEEKPVKTYVKVGEDDGEIIEVLEGLKSDSQVVTRGQNYITEESDIKVVSGGQ
jgi:RND family efflux transporter MFP subunit